MRTSWIAAGLLTGTLATLALAGGSAATAGPEPAGTGARAATVLRYDLAFRSQRENYVDLGAPGPGVGDLLVFQDRVLSRGRQVAVQGGSCTITALLPDGFQTFCTGTVLFAGGDQVSFQGLVTDEPEKPMAVAGGTGRFRGAGGELTVLENGDETGTLTIRLR